MADASSSQTSGNGTSRPIDAFSLSIAVPWARGKRLGAPLQEGQYFGGDDVAPLRYEVVSDGPIGQGAMGRVYRAVDHALRRNVAIKELLTGEGHPDHEVIFRRFCNEALVAAQMDHPHIAAVFDRGECDGRPWYALQWMRGARGLDGLIDDAVRRGELPPIDDGVTLLKAMASALRAAHGLRIWHRDVKPSNILLSPLAGGGWDSKLVDWGISHDPKSKQTDLGSVPGTVQYQAPECFAIDFGAGLLGRLEQIDHRVDLYALGVTFYEYFSGEHPYSQLFGTTEGVPPGDWKRAIADVYASPNSFPPPLSHRRPEVPDRVSAAIHRLLARDPKDRYQSADELLEELNGENAVGGLYRLPRRRGVGPRLSPNDNPRRGAGQRQGRGRRVLSMACWLVCTAAASAGAALWWSNGPGKAESAPTAAALAPAATVAVPSALRRPAEPNEPTSQRVVSATRAASRPKTQARRDVAAARQLEESPAKWPAFLFEDEQ